MDDDTKTTGKKNRRGGAAMSKEDLNRLIQEEVSQAEIWAQANIRGEQERNLQYYLGMPMGNEVDGRSQLTSWDVFEVVESAMPSFIEPFFSGDNIGEFDPRGPEDEAYAEQATDVVNYIIRDQNPGFTIFTTWFKDALLSKIGIVRAEWEEQDPKRIELEDLTDDAFYKLMQDPKSEVIEHSAKPDEAAAEHIRAQYAQAAQQAQVAMMQGQPAQMPPEPQIPMLHDVTVLQEQAGRVCIENVRPENFVVSRGAKSLDASRVLGEFITMTRSDIEEAGIDGAYEVSDFDIGGYSSHTVMSMLRDDTSAMTGEGGGSDESMEPVILFRGFIRADVNGDGVAEYRRVLAGGNMLLEDEEADGHDYAVLTPIPLPHRVVGMAYADPAADIQRLNTALTRQYLDSLYAANNPKTYVNANSNVNLDDLLSTRIGGIVRGNGPAGEAIQPLTTSLVSRDALEGIQLGQSMRESRLGITRYNQGLDSETLNKTATGIAKVMGAADKRQLMTLRILAETGVKQLFRLVLRLVTKYQDAESVIRLRGQWVSYDPRGWNPDMDATISVGIGSGDKTETLMQLQQFGQYMQWAQQNGCVLPVNVYEFGKMLAKNAKLKGADTKLLTQPNPNPPPPPPSPEQIKAQTQVQLKQMDLQDAAHKFQAQQQMQMQIDANRQEWEARQKQLELEQQARLEQITKTFEDQLKDKDIQFQQWKAQFDRDTALLLKNMDISAGMQKHNDQMHMAGVDAARQDMSAEADRAAQSEQLGGQV